MFPMRFIDDNQGRPTRRSRRFRATGATSNPAFHGLIRQETRGNAPVNLLAFLPVLAIDSALLMNF